MSVDICFISPPQRAYNHYRPPLALMLLASSLEKTGIKTEIIDPKSKKDVVGQQKGIIVNQILQQIDELNPKIVGISCYTPEFNDVVFVTVLRCINENGDIKMLKELSTRWIS